MQQAFHILTFGCQMNFNDSSWLERSFLQRGFVPAPLQEATVIVVNTCSVREKPEQKVYNTLRKIQAETRQTPGAFVVVAGCVAQQIGSGFFEKFPQVRLVCGGDGIKDVPNSVEKLFQDPQLRLCLVDFSQAYPERDAAINKQSSLPVAHVNIMQGCDNYCAYCIVPYTRGPQKSRNSAAILQECQELVAHGTREICLLGQNVNAFGKDDKGDGTSFASLVTSIAQIAGLERLRFMTPHPKDITLEDIAAFGALPNLCPHIHLPMQAGSDAVLTAMGRKYTAGRFLEIVAALREACPQISFSSDIIVGFPGESEDDFLQTLEMMEKVNYRSTFSFCYSDRPGTRASLMPMKVDAQIMLERLHRLQQKQDSLTEAWLLQREGAQCTVLLESQSKKGADNTSEVFWQGRDPHGVTVNVPLAPGVGKAGLLVPVRIVQAKKHTLMGQQEGQPW